MKRHKIFTLTILLAGFFVACSVAPGGHVVSDKDAELRDVLTPVAAATPQNEEFPIPTATWEITPTRIPWPTDSPVSPTTTPLATFAFPTSLGYGIQIHGCGYPVGPALDLVAAAGFDWVKQQVRWEELEPELGTVDWSCIDRVVDGAEARGLRVLLSVTTSPRWSHSGQDSGPPDILPLFGQFCLRMVERYRGRIHAVEVFNEPNLDREWGDRLDPLAYVTLLEWAYYGIKQIDPNVMVISAGLAPTRWNDWATAVDDWEYLHQMASAGAHRFTDCLGMHFNHGTSSPLEAGEEFERQTLNYYDTFTQQVPICITELGFATPDRTGGHLPPGFEWAAQTSAEQQAQWLVDGFQWAKEHPDVVRLIVVWNLNYHTDDPDNPNLPYALWSPGGLMPAYHALQSMEKN